jgi:hypothetical protein
MSGRLMRRAVLAGRFQFVKRGQNYGCQRIGDAS